MEVIALPTEADLHAEAVALAPPPELQVRSWEDFGETLEGRRSGLKALRAAALAEACRLSRAAGQQDNWCAPRVSFSSSSSSSSRVGLVSAKAAAASALMALADDDALFLMAFLRHAKFDIPAAVRRLRAFAAFLVSNPWALTPDRALVERVFGGDAPLLTLVPSPTSEGDRVFFVRAKRMNGVGPADLTTINRAAFWALCGLLREPTVQLGGVCFLDDMEGVGLGILRALNSQQNRFGWRIMQTVLPLRLRGLHVFRQPVFFFLMWVIVQTVMNRKVRERLCVYGNDSGALVQALGAAAVPEMLGGSAVLPRDGSVRQVMGAAAHIPWLGSP